MSEVNVLHVQQGEQVFHVRAAAIIMDAGQVLLHRADGDGFWTMPGGRVQMGETGEDTVRREMQEEIGTDVDVERMLYVAEEFFDYRDHRHHEICLYYEVNLPDGSNLLDKTQSHEGEEDGTLIPQELIFQWFPVDQLNALDMPLYPAVLREKLQQIAPHVEHVIRME